VGSPVPIQPSLAHDNALHLAEVVQQIAQIRDLPALMAIVRRAARELTGADGATLVLRDGDNCHYADEDAIGPLWKGQRFPLTTCISGYAMLNAEPVIIADIYADPRVPHAAYRPTFVKSLCMVPIGRQKPLGAIGCYWADTHYATPIELELQQALADATAIGIANIALYRQLDEARQLAEARAAEAQRNETLFRASFEHAGTGVAHVSLDGRWLRVNRRLCDIVGYSHDELLSQTFQDITYPPDLQADLQYVDQMLCGQIQDYSMEKRYIHRDGQLVWINLTVTMVCNEAGAPDYFIAIIEDIQRRKQAEEALEEEREVFRNLADIAAEYFWELDEQFRFKEISASIADHSRMNYKDYFGKTRWELPFEGLSEADWAKHRKTLANHLPFRNLEGGLRNEAGEMRWFRISGAPVFSKSGQFRGYHGASQDITESKQTEVRLRQHAMVFENSQEGVVITDAQARVIDANAAFERITEYRLDDIRGKNMRFMQSGRHDRAFFLDMWQSINETGNWQGEIWNRRKGGEIYLEWINISTVNDESGKRVAYVGTSVDITRMQHVQTEMERLAHHDALTGLPNRLLLMSRLEHALARTKRGGLGAVLFLDLDRFKPINDTLGHKAGDELLIAVAARLNGRLREQDTLARLGGDEFVIVLEDLVSPAAAAEVAQDVIRLLATPFELPAGTRVHIGGSVGIALFPTDSTQPAQIIEQADRALYAAKRAGRECYSFYGDQGLPLGRSTD